jgi:hypothetical protein
MGAAKLKNKVRSIDLARCIGTLMIQKKNTWQQLKTGIKLQAGIKIR